MVFEFIASENTTFMTAFAKSIGSKIENGMMILPESFGKGYIKGLIPSPMIKMMIHQYKLKEDLIFRRISNKEKKNVVTITFHNIFHQKSSSVSSLQHSKFLPSVQITSTDINFETFFPANTEINTIILAVHVDLLKSVLNSKEENTLFENILSGNQPYLYEEIISPQMQEVAAKIVEANVPEQLHDFYFKLKAEELIYCLFVELLKRQDTASQSLNIADVKTMYLIKDTILSNMDIPPKLNELVKFSGMSESKLKRLFKQIFGNSIYNYYQSFRMKEAAYLIKEQKLSVSEVGYRLGFSNLSHFSRLFENI